MLISTGLTETIIDGEKNSCNVCSVSENSRYIIKRNFTEKKFYCQNAELMHLSILPINIIVTERRRYCIYYHSELWSLVHNMRLRWGDPYQTNIFPISESKHLHTMYSCGYQSIVLLLHFIYLLYHLHWNAHFFGRFCNSSIRLIQWQNRWIFSLDIWLAWLLNCCMNPGHIIHCVRRGQPRIKCHQCTVTFKGAIYLNRYIKNVFER